MAKAMFKPDVALDGLEFSAVTRLIELAHQNKDLASEDDLEKGQETKDEDGKKVHPAAMPAGDEHKQDGEGDTNLPRPGNDVPKLKAEAEKTEGDKKADERAAPDKQKKK